MYVRAMKQELCTFGDSAFKLNVLVFVFKANIAQYKDEW